MHPLTATSLALALTLGGAAVVAPIASQAYVGIGVSVGFAPPPLPYYEQPPIPGPGYIWTPGYWAWSDYEDDYYWVPGTWVQPPEVGVLWTPPWWGFVDGAYVFNDGYWGPSVGFYGGINYGFGYGGFGYEGGYWRGRDFYYNRTVNNINNININNVYNRPVYASNVNRVSFNGPGGVQARPTPQQLAAVRTPRLAPTPAQQQHFQMARTQPGLRAGFNHGAPPIAATARPAMLRGPGVVPAARAGAPYRADTAPSRPPAATRYGQGPVGGSERFNSGYRPQSGYNNGYRAQPGYNNGYRPSTAPAQTYNRGYNPAYRVQPPSAQANNGGYRPPVNNYAGYRPPSRPAQNYNRAPPEAYNGGYRPPANYAGVYHQAPRPPVNYASVNRPPPRPENFGGGYRPPPQAMARPAQPPPQAMARPPQPAPQARSAPPPQQRREPPR